MLPSILYTYSDNLRSPEDSLGLAVTSIHASSASSEGFGHGDINNATFSLKRWKLNALAILLDDFKKGSDDLGYKLDFKKALIVGVEEKVARAPVTWK